MPTEQCNLRCTYCFEDFRQARMPPVVVHGVKRLLDRRAAELLHLATDWFGGEPLLAFDVVEEVQLHARRLAAQFPRMQTRSYMTTNGYLLTPERLRRLLDLGVRRFQIALDGPQEVHDRKRVRAGGQPTFGRIWDNLLAASASDGKFEITVRLQIDRDNRGSIAGFIERLHAAFGADRRFRVAPVPLVDLDPSRNGGASFLAGDEAQRILEAAKGRARSLKLRVDRPPEPGPRICHAARPDSFIVRADGTLAKCTVALSRPENRVGRLREDGRVELDAPAVSWWMRGLWSRDEQELACPMQGLEPAAAQADRPGL